MNRPYRLPNIASQRALQRKQAQGWLPRGWIDGLTIANDTTDATNDISIAAGACRSTVNIVDGAASTLAQHQRDIEIPVSILKQLDVAWEPANFDGAGFDGGGRSGMKSASSISNTTWHIYAIGGPGVRDDILAHDSATQSSVEAALPGGYTAYRRIASILRESAAIVSFVQHGDYFQRAVRAADVSAANPGTSAVTRTLSVPIGINVLAEVTLELINTAAGGISFGLLTDLAITDSTPATANAHVADVQTASGRSETHTATVLIRTSTSATIRSRISFSDASVTVKIGTRGWYDMRGRNA